MKRETVLDLRGMPPRERHPKIFEAWEGLPVGGSLTIINDHDPKPLYYEFRAERDGEFEWTPVERGPETWSVAIKRIGPPGVRRAEDSGSPGPRPLWAGPEAAVVDVRPELRAGGEPFSKILAAASAVPLRGVFAVRAIFEPRPLYAVLGARGFESWTERLAEDDWKVYFRKAAEPGGCGHGGCGHG